MATEEQAKKKIVSALRKLRVILTQGPRERYPEPSTLEDYHPEVKELQAEIEEALAPHAASLDPRGPYFRDFIPCDVLSLTELPAHWQALRELDHYIEYFGGKQKPAAIPLRAEDELILATLADAYPAAVTQPELEHLTRISRRPGTRSPPARPTRKPGANSSSSPARAARRTSRRS